MGKKCEHAKGLTFFAGAVLDKPAASLMSDTVAVVDGATMWRPCYEPKKVQ